MKDEQRSSVFSRSDGRTRDWSECGGTVAWIKSVKTPCDEKGRKLWGHGVGLSASELCMAKEGKTWEELFIIFIKV